MFAGLFLFFSINFVWFSFGYRFFSPPWLEFHSRNIAVATGCCLLASYWSSMRLPKKLLFAVYTLIYIQRLIIFFFFWEGCFYRFCNSHKFQYGRKRRWNFLIHNFYLWLSFDDFVMAFELNYFKSFRNFSIIFKFFKNIFRL